MKIRVVLAIVRLAAALALPLPAWAQDDPVEPAASVTATEEAALRMLQLRLQACESKAESTCTPEPSGPAPAASAASQRRARAAVYGSYLHYSGPSALSAVSALTTVVGVDGPTGGVWLGNVLSSTGLRYQAGDFRQDAHVLGAWKQLDDLRLDASIGRMWTNSATTDGAWVGTARGLWLPGALGLDLGIAVTSYPSRTVAQVDPQLVWLISPQLEAAIGGRLGLVDSTAQLSAQLGLTWRPLTSLSVSASAWAGKRQYAVDAGGLSVWSSDDVYKGGYRLGASLALTPAVALDAVLQHDLGSQQNGMSHDFQLIGGTIGVRVNF